MGKFIERKEAQKTSAEMKKLKKVMITFGILAVLAVGFYIFLQTPAGKRWIDNL